VNTSGSITYNGHTFEEFIPQRTASYISQTDTHIGELTVRETFDFAARVQGVGAREGTCPGFDEGPRMRLHVEGKTVNFDIDFPRLVSFTASA
jgi:hypothetical protein